MRVDLSGVRTAAVREPEGGGGGGTRPVVRRRRQYGTAGHEADEAEREQGRDVRGRVPRIRAVRRGGDHRPLGDAVQPGRDVPVARPGPLRLVQSGAHPPPTRGGRDVRPGRVRLRRLGVGARGQLGNGKREDEAEPTMMGKIGWGVRIVQVAAGGGLVRVAHSLLLTSTGRVLSFGTAQYGALGHGYDQGKTLSDVLRPKYIEALRGEKIVCVAAGELHSGAVTEDGDVYTWGEMI